MSRTSNFNVTFPQKDSMVDGISFILIILTILVIATQVLFNKENPILMCIVFCPILLFAIVLKIMVKLFYVKVNGSIISVRTYFGRRYSFNISDITKIEWTQRVDNRMNYERIIMETKNGDSLSVDDTMMGFNKMTKYILKNVEPEKIHRREITL